MAPTYADSPYSRFRAWWDQQQATPGGVLGGLIPKPPPVTAPEPAAPAPAAPVEATPAAPVVPGEPPKPPTTLEEFRAQRDEARAALAEAEKVAKDENQPPDIRVRAQTTAGTLRTGITAITTQIAAEENRIRDEAAAAEKEAKAQKEKERLEAKADAKVADTTPKNGDERWTPIETKDAEGRTVRGVGKEVYTNGVWKYQPGTAKADTGFGSGPQGPGEMPSVVTDGRGTYWTLNPRTGEAKAISGPQAAAKTITDPDGNVYLQNPDGTPGEKLFDAAPKTITDNGRVIGLDPRTYQKIFEVDTKTPEGRALADRLEVATVEAAEQATQPKFASAQAQYAQEAQRRQKLARTELDRLLKLQEEGQISPEQAETQFNRWMGINVEGPLAGYERAAQQERQEQEQADLVRTNAERTRVDEYNTRRGQLAYEAGEAGRKQAIEIGERTRAPEYIADLGRVANSMATGQPFSGFSPGTFDVANYRKVVPNVSELADAAVDRLLSRIGGPATERDVNVPRQPLPSGDGLRSLMDSSRYSGPLLNAPTNEQPLPGQEALDQGNGTARSVYSNGRYIDWPVRPTVAAP